MDQTTLESLEYPLILSELEQHVSTTYGREKVLALEPASDPSAIEEGFRFYTEVSSLMENSGALPIGGLTDIRPLLSKAAVQGSFLIPEELIEIKNLLATALSLRGLELPSFKELYPKTFDALRSLSEAGLLSGELKRIIDDDGRIADRASTELREIRRSLASLRGQARKVIDSMRHGPEYKEILQDDIFTIRDDRFVLLVRASEQSRLAGVIHGRSQTGETFFIEPYEVVELNNRLAILKKDEKAEEIRILKAVTAVVAAESELILADIEVIASLDLLQAKARFALVLNAVVPGIDTTGAVELKGARHPLLILKERHGANPAVPVDIVMPPETRVLVISGANTGGKTVALKTLGLLTLMAQSSLPIPASGESRINIFSEVSADIGDRQGIADDLSTFSAHVKRVSDFLKTAGSGSLVLLDEIGVGTDPSEGSVLALALLEELSERGARVAVTTHINLLKAHATVDSAFMNASVIFNEDTLEPAYNLSYGMPGESMGLSIAANLGMPEALVARAREKLSTDESAFIESIKGMAVETVRLRGVNERLSKLASEREQAVGRLREERSKVAARVRKGVEAKAEAALEEIARIVEKLKQERANPVASGKEAVSAVREAALPLIKSLSEPHAPYRPAAGDRARISGSKTSGVIARVFEETKEAELSTGRIKVRASWDKLVKTGGGGDKKARKAAPVAIHGYSASESASLSVVGKRVEEALKLVTKFIDDAHLNGLERVEIRHGVGTGALLKAIREYLSEVPVVEAFYAGTGSGAGDGVTVVELRGH